MKTERERVGTWMIIGVRETLDIDVYLYDDILKDPEYAADEAGCLFRWEAGLTRFFPWPAIRELRWTPNLEGRGQQ